MGGLFPFSLHIWRRHLAILWKPEQHPTGRSCWIWLQPTSNWRGCGAWNLIRDLLSSGQVISHFWVTRTWKSLGAVPLSDGSRAWSHLMEATKRSSAEMKMKSEKAVSSSRVRWSLWKPGAMKISVLIAVLWSWRRAQTQIRPQSAQSLRRL